MSSSLIELLMVPPDQRTITIIDSICRLTSNLKFFQDLTEKEESSKLHQECCKVMSLTAFQVNQFIFHKGEEADAMFIVLKGILKILANDPDDGKNLPHQTKIKNASANSGNTYSYEEMRDNEYDILTVGQCFGDLALINDRPRYFSVVCLEPTLLAVLTKQDYQIIAKAQEKQFNDKIDFIRSLDTFRTWTRVAIQKLSYFFKSNSFKKGKTVYKEGDPPKDVYIVKSGEFIFTQKYLMDTLDPTEDETFGQLTRRTIKKPFRLKKLNFVIKCKGEIFGYSEIYEKLQGRLFTCTCNSSTGELLVISDKNFAKRITHPDSLKLIEDRCEKSKFEITRKLNKLKITEKLKDQMSFTPSSRIKTLASERENSPKIEVTKSFYLTKRYKTPNIIERFIDSSRKNNAIGKIQPNDAQVSMFPTEVTDKNIKNKVTFMNSSFLTKPLKNSTIK